MAAIHRQIRLCRPNDDQNYVHIEFRMTSIVKSAVVIGVVSLGVAGYLSESRRTRVTLGQTQAPKTAALQQQPQPAAPPAARPTPSGQGQVVLETKGDGHFHTRVSTLTGDFDALVDTGASMVALTAEAAKSINIYPREEEYTVKVSTANGVTEVAPVKIEQMRIGSITVYDVKAVVMRPGASNISLLGMSYLSKLNKFEVAGSKLILQQ
jgi:clan AA aspartic protease (TIGR02281 family)